MHTITTDGKFLFIEGMTPDGNSTSETILKVSAVIGYQWANVASGTILKIITGYGEKSQSHGLAFFVNPQVVTEYDVMLQGALIPQDPQPPLTDA